MAYVDKEWTEKQFENFSQKVSESFVRKDSPEAIGKDGVTPHIDPTTKHWFIGDTDTGIIAEGQSGVSPTLTIDEIEGGHKITIVDATGTKSFDVMDGSQNVSTQNYFAVCDVDDINSFSLHEYNDNAMETYQGFSIEDITVCNIEDVTEQMEGNNI